MRLRCWDNRQILTVGFIVQKNAPLQSNLHENAFNPHLKWNESLACRITPSYIVQEEWEEGKTPHEGKINLGYFYGCRGAAFSSQHISLQWTQQHEQTGNCWPKSTAAGSQLTRQKNTTEVAAQRRDTSETWSAVRQSYWSKKAVYFKAVYHWNKIDISLSATLVFLIPTSLFFRNSCFLFSHVIGIKLESETNHKEIQRAP